LDQAIAEFETAVEINPAYTGAYNNLGNALLEKGDAGGAIASFQRGLEIDPSYAAAWNNLGNAMRDIGRFDVAVTEYRKALAINPDYPEAEYNLAITFRQMGRFGEAIAQYQKALQLKPDYLQALNNLAYLLAGCRDAELRNGGEAVRLAQRANQLSGGQNPAILGTLAGAYAEQGRFPQALDTVNKAIQLAEAQGNISLANTLQGHLQLYQAGKPMRMN
jgi:superkiller protein 3